MNLLKTLAAAAALAFATAACGATPEAGIEAHGPSGILKGTFAAPDSVTATTPVVLILPGSGPTDRDGNSPLGIRAAPYRMLAEGLAAQGVASARIDKRGLFASAGAAADADHLVMADYAADAHAWIAALKQRTGASCVWLLGHSEGGLIALVAAKDPHDICGLILVSTPGRPAGDILREQLKANPANAPILDEALRAVDALAAGHRYNTTGMTPALLPLFRDSIQDFLIDEMSYDPAHLVATYAGPVLVLQGTTDLQVSVADAERLAAARPGVRLVKLDGVNHVLKVAPAERSANAALYADPFAPLAPGIVDAIAAFVKAPPRAN